MSTKFTSQACFENEIDDLMYASLNIKLELWDTRLKNREQSVSVNKIAFTNNLHLRVRNASHKLPHI